MEACQIVCCLPAQANQSLRCSLLSCFLTATWNRSVRKYHQVGRPFKKKRWMKQKNEDCRAPLYYVEPLRSCMTKWIRRQRWSCTFKLDTDPSIGGAMKSTATVADRESMTSRWRAMSAIIQAALKIGEQLWFCSPAGASALVPTMFLIIAQQDDQYTQ